MIHRTRAMVLPEWTGRPIEEDQDGWPVAMRFESEPAEFPIGLTDLTHRPKGVLQGEISKQAPGLKPGGVAWDGHAFICCRSVEEASIFDIDGPIPGGRSEPGYTDMTDGWVLLALWGKGALSVMQRLVEIDVERPDLKAPFYLATRTHSLTLQLIRLRLGFLLACDRSHGQNLFDALVHSGRHLGLQVVGLDAFRKWFDSFNK